jgi:hypothetical protein
MRRHLPGAILALAGITLLLAGLSSSRAADTRPLPPNTWVNMRAGGVALGRGVADEGYSSFVYSPGLRKALVFAQYHAIEVGWGEDQNALLAYDFAGNRWDILEVTEAAWSEFLPGVGHDQGNVAVDPANDLYITHGNMTLHGNTPYQTYVYDLKAGRGKRMMPANEPWIGSEAATAYSPDHGLLLSTRGPSSLYDPRANVWTAVPGSPPSRQAPSLVYDAKRRLFVMFGGSFTSDTWTFDPAARAWTKRAPAEAPPGRNAGNMAYDSEHGVILLVGGKARGGADLSDVWVYDTGANMWTRLPVTAPAGTITWAGNNLTYDSHHKVFLLKDSADLRNVWALRYVPARSSALPAPGRSMRATGTIRLSAVDAPASWIEVPDNTWVARRLPGSGKGPMPGKHQRAALNPENGRIYFLGGDWVGPIGYESGRNELYSYSVPDDKWLLEFPYCGPPGTLQPSHPDEVGWLHDSKRKVLWMLPGYMGEPQGNCPQSTLVRFKIMTFDPATRTWTDTGRSRGVVGEAAKFAHYDPVSDTIVRFYYDGGDGAASLVYDIATDKWTKTVHRDPRNRRLNDARLGEEYSALDPDKRVLYLIEPVQGRLYQYKLDTRELVDLGETPATAEWGSAMPIWDSVNRVLLWPRIPNFSKAHVTLYVYHPDARRWEQMAMIQPQGLAVRSNVAVFDPIHNVLVLMGGHHNNDLFLYRYGRGAPASRQG